MAILCHCEERSDEAIQPELTEPVTMGSSVASALRFTAMGNTYWVSILASPRNGTLYLGVANRLRRRVWQHRNGEPDSFTKALCRESPGLFRAVS